MKKITLLMAFFALLSWQVNAQTIIIGSGTTSTTSTGSDPIDGYYESFHYQVVYTAAELIAAGLPLGAELTGLGFSINGDYGGGSLIGYSIKLGHTTAINSATHDAASTIEVKAPFAYDPIVTAAGAFDMIPFSTNFSWDGVSNILVDICSSGPNPYITPYGQVRTIAASTTSGSRYVRADAAGSECGVNTSTTNSTKPQISFSYTLPACLQPSSLTATNITTNSADLGWTEIGTATTWNIEWGTTGFAQGTGTMVAGITTNPYNLTPLTANTSYQFYVQADCGGSGTSTWAGPFSFTTPPTCPAPTVLTATNITPNAADLGWTENGSATLWQIEGGPTGFVLGTGLSGNVPSNPFTTGGLAPVTTYDFYVRAICGIGDTSTWAGPFTFTTACPVYIPNYTQPFTTFLPNTCWNEADAGTVATGPSALGASPWAAGTAIGNTAKINLFTTTRSDWVLSPFFDLSLGGYEVVLDVAVTNWNSAAADVMGTDDSVRIVYSENGITWNNLMTWTVANNLPNALTTFSALIPSTGNNVQFGILATDGPIDNLEDYDFHIDNFIVRTPPTCNAPSVLTASTITAVSADLGWTENGSATIWNLEWGTTGFAQGTGTMVTGTTTNPYNLTGLTANTSYQFYVQADCGGSGTSTWAGPFTFYTGYCVPSSSSASTYVNNFTTIGGATNISNLLSGFTAGGYFDGTAQFVESYATGTFDFNAQIVGGTAGFSIWIDWNNNMILDNATEKVFNTVAYANGPFISTITVTVATPVGDYRMRITTDYTASNPANPCAAASRAEFEDYTVTVSAPPSCTPPSVLTATNITATVADLGWTENGAATTWNLEWGTTGFAQGTGTMVAGTTTNPHNLVGLTANTSYAFYVQADCGGSGTSTWAGPFTFTTSCNVIAVPFLEDFEVASASISCWSQIQEIGTGNWTFATGAGGGTILTAQSGTNNARFVSTSPSGGGTPVTKLVSPTFDLTTLTTPQLSFYYGQEDWTGDQNTLKVYYRISPSDPWVQIADYITNIAVWTKDSLTLPNPTATYQIAFEGINNYGRANVVDDVEITEALTCSDPSNLTAFNVTQTSAMLDWTENGTATTWNIEWGFQGFALGTGNPQVVLSKPYLLNGLQPATAYDYYVQADCGTDSSGWVGSYTFTTPPCFPIGLDLGIDTTLCSDYSITLNAPTTGPYGWSWSTGESTPSIVLDTTSLGGNGVYNVSVMVIDFISGCIYVDDINLTFSPCVGLNENVTSSDFAIYPNPSNGLFTIINPAAEKTTIEVMNIQGQVVYKNISNEASQVIDLRENAKGVYFVNVIADNGVANYKIVIQ